MRYEYTSYAVGYGPDPPGLNYPVITDEAWSFSLPGAHSGPLLVTGLPGGASQFAATVINNDGGKIWTDVRCGPLPYQDAPGKQPGDWKAGGRP